MPIEMARNMMKRIALKIFGWHAVTKKRMDMASFVEWIVAKFRLRSKPRRSAW